MNFEGDNTIEREIVTIVARQVNREPSGIGLDSELAALGIESLDIVEIIFALEEKFGIEIPFEANAYGAFDLNTVGDVVASVTHLLKK